MVTEAVTRENSFLVLWRNSITALGRPCVSPYTDVFSSQCGSFSFSLMELLLSALLALQVLSLSSGYPNGAPTGACEDMMPRHAGVQPQPSPAPYVVLTNSKTFQPGQPVTGKTPVSASVDDTSHGWYLRTFQKETADQFDLVLTKCVGLWVMRMEKSYYLSFELCYTIADSSKRAFNSDL